MKNLLNPKKPFLWLLIVVVTAAVVLSVLFIPRKAEVPDALDACVESVLHEVHRSSHTTGKYPALAYTALAVKEKGDSVTVYGVMLYREYTATTADKLEVWGAAHYPFAITATANADGSYTATDCWWPEDGANHVSSIRKKFPSYCQRKAVNYRNFYAEHAAACDALARQNIADSDKYTVMESANENIRLAYSAGTLTAYITFSGGYATDGTYAVEGGQAVFTFGNRKVVFDIDGDDLVYDTDASENVPAVWKESGSIKYLTDGIRFKPDDGLGNPFAEDTAPVGPAVTASASKWTDKTGLHDLFGQYIPSTFFEEENPKYLPVRPVETREQLDSLIELFSDDWTGLTAENFAQYDEAFFKNNYLMMTYYRDGMASAQPKVDSYVYVKDGDTLWLSVRLEVTQPAAGDTVVGEWLLFSGIAKADYDKITALEAYVNKVVQEKAEDATNLSFTGVVKEIKGNAVLMETTDVEQFKSGVWVELTSGAVAPEVGETYVVTYEDIVMPSLPPRITAVTITKP